MIEAMKEVMMTSVENAFTKLDADGNNQLDLQEVKQVMLSDP